MENAKGNRQVPNRNPSTRHAWKFFRAGGVDQVEFKSGQDLLNLRHLDEKLWVALSCPTLGLESAEDTLTLMDTDHDGLVRVPELLEAIEWTASRIKDPDTLLEDDPNLKLDQIQTLNEQGEDIADAAREILRNLGKADASSITLEETAQSSEVFANARFNGDGVIPPSAAEDPETATAIRDIVGCLGGERDRSGEMGINQERLDTFYKQLEEYTKLANLGEPEAAPAGYTAYRNVREKLDDYFARCALVAFDPAASESLNEHQEAYDRIADSNLATLPPEVKALPLAHPRPDHVLQLEGPVNPAWKRELADLRSLILEPMLGADASRLSKEKWDEIKKRFASKEHQESTRHKYAVRTLPAERIQMLMAEGTKEHLANLIEQDAQLSDEVAAIDELHRLARYKADLHLIARNFVSFADFFSRERSAIFQAGVLYLDSRSCDLCVRVRDPSVHSTLASLSRCYLIYCKCERADQDPIQIAAMLSNGGSDNLMVGRHGLFYDREGRDWQATVVKIIENPISIRQAFWSPYKKFARFVDEFMTKRAEAAEKSITERLAKVAETDPSQPAAAKKPTKVEVGAVAAIGVALGSIGTFVSMILIRAIELGPWLPLALVGIVLLISLPSMFLAALRLRHRTLGPILDASGWAINAQIKINMPLARFLTQVRSLPPHSSRSAVDAFANKNKKWYWLALALALVAAGVAYYTYREGYWEFPDWTDKPAAEAPPPQPDPQSAQTTATPAG